MSALACKGVKYKAGRMYFVRGGKLGCVQIPTVYRYKKGAKSARRIDSKTLTKIGKVIVNIC